MFFIPGVLISLTNMPLTWCELDMFVLNSSPAIYEDFNFDPTLAADSPRSTLKTSVFIV